MKPCSPLSFNRRFGGTYRLHLQGEEISSAITSKQGGRFYNDGLRAGLSGFDSRQRKILMFSTASRPTLGPSQPPIQCVTGAISPGVMRSGREADHSPPCSAEVKNTWTYTSTPPYVFMA
jgi:hypothetical protein